LFVGKGKTGRDRVKRVSSQAHGIATRHVGWSISFKMTFQDSLLKAQFPVILQLFLEKIHYNQLITNLL